MPACHRRTTLATLVFGLLLAACGGDSVAPPATQPPGGGGGGGGGNPAALIAPANLSVVFTDTDRVQLSWQDNSTDETGFELERAPAASSTFTRVLALAANTTTATDSTLSPGTSVVYRLRAVRGSDASPYTGAVNAQTDELPPAEVLAPGAVMPTAQSPTRVRITWEDRSSDEDGFEVSRALASDTTWSDAQNVSANTTAFVDSTLTDNTAYRYRVRALRGTDRSAFSVSDTVRTHALAQDLLGSMEAVAASALPGPGVSASERNPRLELLALRAQLREIPSVVATYMDTVTMTLQAVSSDGTSIVFVNNRPPDEGVPAAPARISGGSSGRAAGSTPSFTTASLGRVATVPSAAVANSKTAVVATFDGGEDLGSEVRAMLARADYRVLGLGASVADMKQYRNLGALYLDTHGVSYRRVTGLRQDSTGRVTGVGTDTTATYFALQTSTKVSGSALGPYAAELTAGELIISLAQNQAGVWEAKLAITERFIQKYWSFDHGVAVIHSCFAGAQPFAVGGECEGACLLNGPTLLDPTVLRSAMKSAGAELVVSFDNLTWSSYAAPSVRMFFDRMLGINQEAAVTPPNRPFGSGRVITHMQERGLNRFTKPAFQFFIGFGGNEVNVTYDGNTNDAHLVPAVRSVEVFDDAATSTSRFDLFGNFGGDQGRVELDGVPLTLQSWTEQRVVATAPTTNPGSGELRVFPPNGVGSNKVPLTEWQTTVTLTTTITPGTLRGEATLDLHFRADVHGYRNRVDGPTEPRPPIEATLAPQSTGEMRGSGRQDEVSFSGTESVQWYPRDIMLRGGRGPDGTSSGGATLTLDPDGASGALCLGLWGYVTVNAEGRSIRQFVMGVGVLGFPRTKALFGCIDLAMGSDYSMPGGSLVLFKEESSETKITWTQLIPVTPPLNATPR